MAEDTKTEPGPAPRAHMDRPGDKGFWCALARRFSDLWDFIDQRDIDKHATAAAVLVFFMWGTIRITEWGVKFADTWMQTAKEAHPISGTEAAAVAVAVLGPWSVLTGAVLTLVVNFYFKARQ